MLVHINGAKCIGIDAAGVTVEVDITLGIGVHLCGLPDVAVKESLLRTVTALQSIGYRIPGKKIVINLAPADMHKNGSGYDLPIALGIIAASGQETLPDVESFLVMGELGLDGSLRGIPGGLPMAQYARDSGFKACVLPYSSALEASMLEGVRVYGARTLQDAVRIIRGDEDIEALCVSGAPAAAFKRVAPEVDFADIVGQDAAKRAMEIAAAGGHNIILVGSPGSGKSSLAKAMNGILPPLSKEEALITSKIYSVVGRGNLSEGLMTSRPFRSPHYSASLPAVIGGGGSDGIYPGEVSLAHGGVLFLDEFGQMPRSVVEALRGPLEDRRVTISRLKTKVEYPASFILVAASNPCPCGYYGDGDRCTCTPSRRMAYFSRLSGPIMDRIDLQVFVRAVPTEQIVRRSESKSESSAMVAKRVLEARRRQQERFAGEEIACNADMTNRHIERYCPLSEACKNVLENLMDRMHLSMRAYCRIIKVARTIADLEGVEDITPAHLCEAASYRSLDKITV